jgi:hypothetical protein
VEKKLAWSESIHISAKLIFFSEFSFLKEDGQTDTVNIFIEVGGGNCVQ